VVLKKNYRFPAESGIGAASRAANAGQGAESLALLKSDASPDVVWHNLPKQSELKKGLAQSIAEGYAEYLRAETVEEALVRFDRFRVLCALRQGVYGVEGINGLVEEILAEKGLIDAYNRWYRGRPVLITVNDYTLQLFNGDIGLAFPDPSADNATRIYFPTPGGGVRAIAPVRLPTHETVYAMTIHKSQGSEFNHVLMLMPPHDSEVLTRELVYTGITRAKSRVDVWGDESVFTAAVGRKIVRESGLREAIWG
jgi:exodeoxyribonuclease V alpha subunit